MDTYLAVLVEFELKTFNLEIYNFIIGSSQKDSLYHFSTMIEPFLNVKQISLLKWYSTCLIHVYYILGLYGNKIVNLEFNCNFNMKFIQFNP